MLNIVSVYSMMCSATNIASTLCFVQKKSPPPKRKTQDLKDFVEEVVKEHNKHRKAHGKASVNKTLFTIRQRVMYKSRQKNQK